MPYNDRTAELLAEETSTTSPPSAATDGVAKPPGVKGGDLILASTAGSGTMEVTIRIWGYQPDLTTWVPLSTGTGAGATANTSGWMNAGAKIEEIAADSLQHYEPIFGLDNFSRIAAEVAVIAGTATAVDLDVVWWKSGRDQ